MLHKQIPFSKKFPLCSNCQYAIFVLLCYSFTKNSLRKHINNHSANFISDFRDNANDFLWRHQYRNIPICVFDGRVSNTIFTKAHNVRPVLVSFIYYTVQKQVNNQTDTNNNVICFSLI